jgi:hypothetical protein
MKIKYFCFFKEEINSFFFNFQKNLRKVSEKTRYFNTGYVSYNANIQPNIMQNYWKNMRENHKYFEMSLENFLEFFCFLFNII